MLFRERHLVGLQMRELPQRRDLENAEDVRIVEIRLQENELTVRRQQAAHVGERLGEVVVKVVENAVADDIVECLAVELRRLIEIEHRVTEVRQLKSLTGFFDERNADVGSEDLKPGLSREKKAVRSRSAADFENASRNRLTHLGNHVIAASLGAHGRGPSVDPPLVVPSVVANASHHEASSSECITNPRNPTV